MGCYVRGDINSMGCFVRGDKNSMGCFVRGDKNSMGCFVRGGKSLWDVLSGVSKNGMGCFVRLPCDDNKYQLRKATHHVINQSCPCQTRVLLLLLKGPRHRIKEPDTQ